MIRFQCLRLVVLALAGLCVLNAAERLRAAEGAFKGWVYFLGSGEGTFEILPGSRLQHIGIVTSGTITVTITPIESGVRHSGTIVLRNALNDTLTLGYFALLKSNPYGGQGQFNVISGSGKFAGASGSGVITRLLGPSNPTNPTRFDGRISY